MLFWITHPAQKQIAFDFLKVVYSNEWRVTFDLGGSEKFLQINVEKSLEIIVEKFFQIIVEKLFQII